MHESNTAEQYTSLLDLSGTQKAEPKTSGHSHVSWLPGRQMPSGGPSHASAIVPVPVLVVPVLVDTTEVVVTEVVVVVEVVVPPAPPEPPGPDVDDVSP